jgi:hypothetical protein
MADEDFLGKEERIKLTRSLFYEIYRKHKRKTDHPQEDDEYWKHKRKTGHPQEDSKWAIHHNNISPETIFVQDNFKISFLSNYLGKESSILKKYCP